MGARLRTRYHRPPPKQTGAHRCYSGLTDKLLPASQGRSERMSERSDNVVRLGCAEQAAIADELRRYWQHVVDEGVPEQLRGLVERFAVSRHDTGAGAVAADAAEGHACFVSSSAAIRFFSSPNSVNNARARARYLICSNARLRGTAGEPNISLLAGTSRMTREAGAII